jgi:ATP-binding cassette subfamily F protein uup
LLLHLILHDEEATVQENVAEGKQEVLVGGKHRHVLGYLQDFLFPPARARTPVKALSGGEKNRLLLAKLFLKPSNILVLDEPTNDLDVETLELLEEIVDKYDGTVLVVSHDREFIDNTCGSIWGFEGNGVVSEIVGGYTDYKEHKQYKEEQAKKTSQAADVKKQINTKQLQTNAKASSDSKPKKLSYKLQLELEQLPALLETLENDVEALQTEVTAADFYKQSSDITQVKLNELAQAESKLEVAFERWEELEELKG